ncbi:MAG TPA: VTT domain-containing protein [Rhodopila sp.]|nr:VTT domain-containing protein [Rhodopila sp.]
MRRVVPLLALAAAVLVAYVFLPSLDWGTLSRHQQALLAFVAAHPVPAAAAYVLAYILVAALSLPQATLLTVAGGLLFGTMEACALTLVGATTGASILLVIVRYALAGLAARQRGRIPGPLRDRLARDGFLYLLALRLAPVFPFWLVNLAAAVAGLRLRVFVPATLLGILPDSLILSSIGAGLGSILARGETPDLSILLAPRLLLPLLGLSILSLLPALLRRRPGAHA